MVMSKRAVQWIAGVALVLVAGTGCGSCEDQPAQTFTPLTFRGSSLARDFSTSASDAVTCSPTTGFTSVDLDQIDWNNPALSGHTFSWQVHGNQASIFDDELQGNLFEGVFPEGFLGPDVEEIDLPSGGVVMNATNPAVTGSITVTGSVTCPSASGNPPPGSEAGSADAGGDGGTKSSDAGTTTSDAGATCTTFDITASLPASGPPGTAVTLTGTGLSCLKYMDFRTDIDGYHYDPSEYQIVSDTEVKTTVPTHGTGETTLMTGSSCLGQFVALSNATVEPVHAMVFTLTGTAKCP